MTSYYRGGGRDYRGGRDVLLEGGRRDVLLEGGGGGGMSY